MSDRPCHDRSRTAATRRHRRRRRHRRVRRRPGPTARHRPPHPGARERCRGRRPGRLGPLAALRPHHGGEPDGVPGHDDDATGDQRGPVGSRSSGGVRRRRGCRSWRRRPTTRPATPSTARRWSTASACCSSASPRPNGPRSCCTRRSSTRTRRSPRILETSEANARQLGSRARRHLVTGRRRRRRARSDHRRLGRRVHQGDEARRGRRSGGWCWRAPRDAAPLRWLDGAQDVGTSRIGGSARWTS